MLDHENIFQHHISPVINRVCSSIKIIYFSCLIHNHPKYLCNGHLINLVTGLRWISDIAYQGLSFWCCFWIKTSKNRYSRLHVSKKTVPHTCTSRQTKHIYNQGLTKSWVNVLLVSESVSVCVCTWRLFACRPSFRLLFEDVIALLLFSSEWPRMDLPRLFSSQWPVQIVNRSPMNCGFSGFVGLQTRLSR